MPRLGNPRGALEKGVGIVAISPHTFTRVCCTHALVRVLRDDLCTQMALIGKELTMKNEAVCESMKQTILFVQNQNLYFQHALPTVVLPV